jgi:outer membrane protein OmpA-like peptidoglycan-associated protein/tetratricopeptide (TPR) repeat protein
MKIFRALLLFVLWFGTSVSAQQKILCPPSQNKKANSYYDKALSAKKSHNDYETIKEYCEKAIEEDSSFAEVYHLLGDAAYLKKDYKTMKDAYGKMIELCPDASPEPHYRLGKYLYDTKNYDGATKYLKSFLDFGNANEKLEKDASLLLFRAKLISHPVPFNPQIVKDISTADPEYLAIITADNKRCFFTRRFELVSKSSLTPLNVEKFMVADLQANGVFNKGEQMPPPFNSRNNGNEGGASVTIDNEHLFFTVNKNGNFDIYYSDYIKDHWGDITNLGKDVNDSVQWDSQPSVSSDGKELYFATYRDSINGTSDIYVTKKNGKWSKPIRLSDKINTNGNEKSPFIHPDKKTLYFSSDSLPGMGGFDIFMSRKDKNGNWSEPVNLGYPINTEADELGFFVSTDGKKGYFASNTISNTGGYDIYSFDLDPKFRPDTVLLISGILKNEENQIPLAAKIELKNITTNEITDVDYDTLTGKYASAVLFKDEFLMTVKDEGYAFESHYFAKDDSSNYKPVPTNLDLKKIELGTAYKLNNILFATDSYELNDVSKRVIQDFKDFLQTNRSVIVAIHGHTDNEGDPQSNLTLSDNRAKEVYNYLIKLGVDPSRISYKGYGQTKPLFANDTPENKAQNRRTEFVIIKK